MNNDNSSGPLNGIWPSSTIQTVGIVTTSNPVNKFQFCPQCGKKIKETWNYCPVDGTYAFEASINTWVYQYPQFSSGNYNSTG